MTIAGFVERDRESAQRFKLTTRIVTVAGALLARMDVARISYPHVKSLRDRLNEASHLAVPSSGIAIQIIQETSSQRLAVKSRVGEETPMHASAVGKALAAYLPEQFDAAVRLGLQAFTSHTITSIGALKRELARVREQGYAIDNEEIEVGTRCIAAPVRDGSGQVVAALGISGPSVRVNRERLRDFGGVVRGEALKLSAALGATEGAQKRKLGPAKFEGRTLGISISA